MYKGIIMKKCTVLVSGGVDSVSVLHHVIKELKYDEVYVLSFNYGQKHSRELDEAAWQVTQLKEVVEHEIMDISFICRSLASKSSLVGNEIDVPALEDISEEDLDQPVTYVPNRNMTLLSLAAAYAESKSCQDLYYGAQAQDEYGYWDCTTDFLDRMNAVLSLNRRDAVRVKAPFVNLNKAQVVEVGMRNGVDFSHTWTCYRGGAKPCEVCPSCVERALAFEGNGHKDPLL